MKIKIGILGIINRTFPGDVDRVYRKFVEDVHSLSLEFDFDVVSIGKALDKLEDVKGALHTYKKKEIDFLLVQQCSFASGKIMEAIIESKLFFGIWGVQEPANSGAVQLNSLCGMNMFCSISRIYFNNETVKYKWFYGNKEDREFYSRFSVTVASLKVIKKLKEANIAIVGGVAPGFLNVFSDKRKIQSRFGVKVNEFDFSDIQKAIENTESDESTKKLASQMSSEVDDVSKDIQNSIETNAIVYEGMKRFADEQNCNCMAVSCWPQFRRELGVMPCAVYGRLTDNGIVAACEGDVEGVLSMFILQNISSGNSSMIMDFTDIHPPTGSIQYWHCGNAPASCGKKGTVQLTTHFKPGSRITCKDDVKVGTVYDMIFEPGEYTVFRLMNDGSKCMLFSGEMLEDDLGKGFEGTRGWLSNLQFDHRDLPFWDLIDTIMTEGIPHHHCLVKGNVVDEVYECMKLLGVEIIHPKRYSNVLN